ncbi:MAG TPA: mechanosensitive ion channel family protein [Ktedonobacterales bacterium]|nr:mechanosensitive ion channel family protein [Ktedonobacterales bacterium]
MSICAASTVHILGDVVFGLNQTQAIQAGLTLFVVLIALSVGSWLARRASKVPIPLESRINRYLTSKSGKRKRSTQGRTITERSMGASRWLGRLTFASVWVAALVAIAFIWFGNLNTIVSDLLPQLVPFGIHLGISLMVLACALGLGRLLQRGFVSSLPETVNRNLATLGGRVVYLAAFTIGAIIILAIWGTGLVLPVALLGVLSVALSLALQDVLKNLVAGIYLLLEHPFVIGDRITLTPYTGQVKDIQIRYTSLSMEGGEVVLIPNSMLFSSPIVNLSEAERLRSTLTVTIPDTGSSGIDRAEAGIHAALAAIHDVYRDPAPQVTVSRAAGGTVDLHVQFWTAIGDPSGGTISSDVIEQIRAQVKDAEIAVLDPSASVIA